MREALSQADLPRDLRQCACGAEYRPSQGRCTHEEAQPYSARFYTAAGAEGIEEGIVGPEGNRIALWRTIFLENYAEQEWFDGEGRAHPGLRVPYPEI